MTPNSLGQHFSALFDVEIANAESEWRYREVLDSPVRRTLKRARDGQANGRPRHRLAVARYDTVNEQLSTKRAARGDDRRADRERLVDSKVLCQRIATGDLESPHEGSRRAQLGVDRSCDCVRLDEGEVVGANFDHGVAQEIASDVSLLIQLRYLSSPA